MDSWPRSSTGLRGSPLTVMHSICLLLTLAVSCFTGSVLATPGHQNPAVAPPVPIFASNALAPTSNLQRRDALLCGEGKPCIDGSCCGTNGKCGYGPTFCGSGNCTSNCDALAMCGPYSIDGDQKCGMNLCCSAYGWCGTDDVHCDSTPTEANGMAPCQAGYGLCEIISAPSCGEGSGSTNGRAIGYYQASNTRDRLCNRISPSQINLDGLTHLYFAFAKFDPSTFAIVPGDTADEELYPEFTALQSQGVKTWIAIGGFDFSDPGTATHTAWSDMVSESASRSAFITSLMAFMDKWGFQGVDIDWEYPAAAARGGVLADTINFVSLVKEMRSAFGDSYGISLTLAPDYWYLRGFDAKGMEPYVDFFGFMAYDLHGSWDSDVKTLGSKVRGQADIRDISNDTLPLWFDDLTPSKINFGLAYYGRGYTLSDPSCNTLDCAFSGPSKPGICTNFAGVMSLLEIENIIKVKNLQPTLLSEAMMKQITWDDQWIGYDDVDTIKLKKAWADGQCFGGTMVWSVDFNSGSGSGDTPTNTTDGTCGPKFNNTVCGDWEGGSCCSAAGYCGSDSVHCGNGCSSGNCTIGGQTTDGTCGSSFSNSFCGTFSGGSCCSLAGYCGSDDAHCGKANCHSGCPTTDGTCGKQSTYNTCLGSSYGDCCSSDGYCGNTTAHCGAGCQNGNCDAAAADVTTNGSCGKQNDNKVCLGSTFGDCCSSYGYCGSTDAYCGAGCQNGNCITPSGAQTTTAPTSTSYISCTHQDQEPGLGITKGYCVCSGSTFDELVATQVTPYNSCAYTALRTTTGGGDTTALPVSTNMALCQVCTIVGNNNDVCTSLDNCTPTPTTTVTPTPTTTVTVTPTPTTTGGGIPASNPAGVTCFNTWEHVTNDPVVQYWYVVVTNAENSIKADRVWNHLNLNGCAPTEHKYYVESQINGCALTFHTSEACTAQRVSNALRSGSDPAMNIACEFTDKEGADPFEGVAGAVDAILEGILEAIKV